MAKKMIYKKKIQILLSAYGTAISSLWFPLVPVSAFSKTVYYDYNSLGHLKQARLSTGTVFDYTYDLVGNRININLETHDMDGDGLGDEEEVNVYGTNPNKADTDGDGLNDGEEIIYWGASWDSDIDNDGQINLLDYDSDGDGYSDGFEIKRATDPSDPNDYPAKGLQAIFHLLLKEKDIETVESD